MFECGLEGIKLKIVKRSQFETGDNGHGEKKSEVEVSQKDNINNSQDGLNNMAGMRKFVYIEIKDPLFYNNVNTKIN